MLLLKTRLNLSYRSYHQDLSKGLPLIRRYQASVAMARKHQNPSPNRSLALHGHCNYRLNPRRNLVQFIIELVTNVPMYFSVMESIAWGKKTRNWGSTRQFE
ncbi:hypothetical protein PsorP6_011602 [Peronosclerospora sorghi]|uniref:Uncharacterized protein n=1 Tax=Peronosclerospora sorghi TaxID=230839 RepID=A0ACC0WK36_9STRA|nr:hypothetical protein PsorP6_011602 [Peronosclerospora sorghi]